MNEQQRFAYTHPLVGPESIKQGHYIYADDTKRISIALSFNK